MNHVICNGVMVFSEVICVHSIETLHQPRCLPHSNKLHAHTSGFCWISWVRVRQDVCTKQDTRWEFIRTILILHCAFYILY